MAHDCNTYRLTRKDIATGLLSQVRARCPLLRSQVWKELRKVTGLSGVQTKRPGSTHCRVRPTFAVASTPGLGMVQIVEHHDDDGDAATRPVESCSPPQSVAAEEHKARGNACFARGEWEDAARHYTLALEAAPADAPEESAPDEDAGGERARRRDRAVYLSNRAACRVKLESHKEAEEDCTAAIAEDDTYAKAYLRRSAARESLDDLEGALVDVERAAELEPGSRTQALASAERLRPLVEAKREEMRAEMMAKLKSLGNSILGNFGLSTDNFKAEKDDATGSYNIQFVQNASTR